MKLSTLFALTMVVFFLSSCDLFLKECSEIYGKIEKECIPTENLNLDSRGGDIDAAIKIANRTTFTHVESYCASACVLIASRGDIRSACHDAVFGLHRGELNIGTDRMETFYEEDERINSRWVNYHMTNTPNDSIFKLSAYTARVVGLIDEVVECE